ncbi:S8 family serine peptidase [Actinoplanes sp. CA-030573]|uniref:S8 family serine peptidase n=1 Tax=Actinoplanes sp. CA-030573 TaxID=3239898 RepID=UPI003D90D8E7
MKTKLLLGAVLIGATVSAPALAHHHPAFRPIEQGLETSPARLLPAVISRTHPVRVVSTTLDDKGRPVSTVGTATDRDAATRLVTRAQRAKNAVSVEVDVPVRTADADPYRPQQWDLDAMRTDKAWSRSTGKGVTVAVVDTGVDSSHPELAGQVLPGGDFITGTEGPSIDPNGHGTHVAGVIAAAAGNGQGIAGVAPDARILPVRVLGANGSGYLSDVANGIVYAAGRGADVINLSVSASARFGAVTNAVAYARSLGVVVVAAAGNMRAQGSPVSYPAAEPGVIGVAATTPGDGIAFYSNAGDYVDVAAPGNSIISTFPGGYRSMQGTSMAAPHVAALAALIRAADHGLGPDAVEKAIESTAVDLGAPGRDDDFGYGRVDAAAALDVVAQPAAPAETSAPAATADPGESTTPGPAPSESITSEPAPASATPSAPTAPTAPREAPPTPTDAPPTDAAPTDAAPTPTPTEATPAPRQTESTPTPSATNPAPNTTNATPTPAPARPAKPPVRIYAVRTGPTQLLVAIDGVDDQTVEVQQQDGAGWTTVRTYTAARTHTIDDLVPNATYRIVVPENDRFAGGSRGPVQM